jgi:hypothetical protein
MDLPVAYQAAYGGTPYGGAVPSPGGPQQFPPNYMVAGGMPGFSMNAAALAPQQQQMLQRMQGQQPNAASMGASAPQRPMTAAQGTPNNVMPAQQAQFSSHQPPSQSQTPNNAQQPNNTIITTPQTPTFPSVGQPAATNGVSSSSTPLSPASETRENERFNLLLDINQELLFESLQLHHTLQELKKEESAVSSGDGNNAEQGKKIKEQESICSQDYNQYGPGPKMMRDLD